MRERHRCKTLLLFSFLFHAPMILYGTVMSLRALKKLIKKQVITISHTFKFI